MTSAAHLIILGSTGEVGKQCLAAALEDERVAAVHTFGRRAPTVPDSTKLKHTSLDFEALLAENGAGPETRKLKDADCDGIVIALGTTRKNAGGAEKFERIDREYVLAAAKAARTEKQEQRVVYCSAQAASSSSSFLYPRSKGLTEEGLASLGYSETVIFRPGYLVIPGGRAESRLAETLFGAVTNAFSTFTHSLQIPTPILGRAMIAAAVSPLSTLKKPEFGQQQTLAGHTLWAVNNAQAIPLGGGKSPKL
ncbi:hypothetical protein JCM10207_003268 [Rhodosporidiobolus poonsookiae]